MNPVYSYILGILTSWLCFCFSQRRNRIDVVAAEYLRLCPNDNLGDDTERLYAFQRSGVGLLKTDKEISEVCESIIHRGRKSPLEGWELVTDHGALRFFREANQRGFALIEFGHVIDVILNSQEKK